MSGFDWREHPLLSFDVETTGVDVHSDRIVTASFVYAAPGGRRARTWIVDPGVPIPDEAAAIHGWTTARVQAHPDTVAPAVAVARIVDVLNTWWRRAPLVVYNARFDLSLLAAECARHGVEFPAPGPVVDPMVIDKHLDKFRRGSRKLVDVCRHYGIDLSEADAHGSEADAWAALDLARIVGAAVGVDPRELHNRQIGWKAEQDASFANYLRRQGKDPYPDLDGSWPMVTTP